MIDLTQPSDDLLIPETPLTDRGTRDPDYVAPVVLRMGVEYIEHLDNLCEVNQRSRREILEILIAEASIEYQNNPDARINPI